MVAQDEETPTLIFTYGTLKKGFSNHNLIQDMMLTGDAVFLGVYLTVNNYPLVCGPYRVPFLLNFPGSGDRVRGELYSVSNRGLVRMDELEGTSRGHYERHPIKLVVDININIDNEGAAVAEGEERLTCAEAYYAHGSYAVELWRKNGERGFGAYSQERS